MGQGYCQGGFSADFTTVITVFLSVDHKIYDVIAPLFPPSVLIGSIYLPGWQSGTWGAWQLLLARYVGHANQQRENDQNPASEYPSKYISILLCSFLLGQVISAAKENIIQAYYPGYFMQSVPNQIHTKQVKADHDDSYQGSQRVGYNLFL